MLKIYKTLILLILAFSVSIAAEAQNGSVKGQITDAETNETLVGCNVLLQGTTIGTTTDLDGNFLIENISPGAYNLVISYISFDQQIQKISIEKGKTLTLNVKLKPASTQLKEVEIKAVRRTNTEVSMISSLKSSNLIASGISSQQIAKSQDKDASEVIRRVPGVSIRDGRFVIVRGLTERYNFVLLNNASTPSSEIDKRAFSFDAIPSDLIDNIFIYKTPAPELPADFAGAVINIKTKNLVDKNSFKISYGAGFLQRTTFQDFYTYKGSKTDWLGFDNGTRALPSDFPGTTEFRRIADNSTEADKAFITHLGQEFSKIWTPNLTKARPDQSFAASIQHRFVLGNISIGNISAITYSNSLESDNIYRAAYQSYDTIRDRPSYSYEFNDFKYLTKVRAGVLMNWSFIFGNNQKIEFRNLLNQLGQSRTILRDGQNHYGGSYERSYELAYESRTTYSGQLSGEHKLFNEKTKLDWVLGYSYGNKLQPDIRRIKTLKSDDAGEFTPYHIGVNFNADPTQLGRLFMNNYENIYVGGANISQTLNIKNFNPEIKAGFYSEFKDRRFQARNIGFAAANFGTFNFNLTKLPLDTNNIFSSEVFNSIDAILTNKNINDSTGFKVDESTNLSDSYTAHNKLLAGYIGIMIPIAKRIHFYPGVRMEKNLQVLDGYNEIGDPVHVVIDKTDFFPSANLSIDLSQKLLFRLAYGKTINRPEFREIAPYSFYDFEQKATIYGNDSLQNCYIQNYDARIEWYPSPGQMISLGGFYKHFNNPIEAHLKDYGTGYNYKYFNARSAVSYGLELDVRKSLNELENSSHAFTKFFKDFTFIVNASLIKSRIKNDDPTERDAVRQLQGQSPYLVNLGIYYQNDSLGFSASLMYNRIGERIAYVGDVNNPHIWEEPFNSLDLTLNFRINRYITLKAGIRNLLDDKIVFQQYEKYMKDTNGDNIGDTMVKRAEINQAYKPGRLIKIGVTVNL